MKIISEQIISKTKFLIFKTISYLDKNNQLCKWDMVSRVNNKKAVMIVPFYGNKLVIIKEFRVPINNYEYGLPAGLIDDGETPQQAGIRELKEETGLDVIDILAVSPPVFSSAGLTDESITIIYAKVGGHTSNKLLQSDEDITTIIADKKQITNIISDKTKAIGAKAWIIFYNYLLTN